MLVLKPVALALERPPRALDLGQPRRRRVLKLAVRRCVRGGGRGRALQLFTPRLGRGLFRSELGEPRLGGDAERALLALERAYFPAEAGGRLGLGLDVAFEDGGAAGRGRELRLRGSRRVGELALKRAYLPTQVGGLLRLVVFEGGDAARKCLAVPRCRLLVVRRGREARL